MSEQTTNRSFDVLAKGLANGTTMSRKQALKLMGAGAATASLALAGCGGKEQANGSDSGSDGSTSETTVAKHASPPKQGPEAEKVAAAAKRAMEKYHLKAILAKVTKGTGEVATVVMGESMTGVCLLPWRCISETAPWPSPTSARYCSSSLRVEGGARTCRSTGPLCCRQLPQAPP